MDKHFGTSQIRKRNKLRWSICLEFNIYDVIYVLYKGYFLHLLPLLPLSALCEQIREGRKQKLSECLKKEFRLTMNILRTTISGDVYEGIRALTIDKDNAPKWDPLTLNEATDDKIEIVFEPFEEHLELQIPEKEEYRWDGKYENSAYATLKVKDE
ncbi:ATP-dependent caseinolytic (Clp) protease/crotonase family protein [Actinidia rufa]|uniref:3-hydroxyisobutyryl-CoA hydrolase n=1 Tax=Actinidia rufa TaxID=165716 RepID=A0A7J0GQ29_9ERIC|nr:ATP-dependent caseinolytic (Clp) protease/crotonase family protein [Actinidia rufa]